MICSGIVLVLVCVAPAPAPSVKTAEASAPPTHRHRHLTVRAYARRLVLHRWHSASEWRALNSIVKPESGWDACAVYPSMHDCGYQGSNSCGIPQAAPCPPVWRGRLFAARFGQVRWLIAYVARRYGDPEAALAVLLLALVVGFCLVVLWLDRRDLRRRQVSLKSPSPTERKPT